jgi:hypothetical protein
MILTPKDIILAGPFIGELYWEFFRFAPYIIHLKKANPDTTLVVYTRQSRFDLYGNYANILVPLRLPKDSGNKKEIYFTMEDFNVKYYNLLSTALLAKYIKKSQGGKVIQIFPEISKHHYKVKWQFPRNKMNYDFRPRKRNSIIVNEYINKNNLVLINFDISKNHKLILEIQNSGYYPIVYDNFYEHLSTISLNGFTPVGSLIELIRRCKFIYSSFDSYVSYLSLLLKTPVITFDTKFDNDYIKLANPFKTKIISCNTISEGIKLL